MGDVGGGDRPLRHRVVVVLAGDLDRPVGQALDRVVAAVVAEGELVGGAAQGRRQQLVAEADPEDGNVPDQVADGVDGVGDGGGVARAVGQEDPVRAAGQDVVGGRRRGDDVDGCDFRQEPQDACLDAEVVGDDRQRPVTHPVLDRGGDLLDQVDAVGAGLVVGRPLEGQLVGGAEGARHRPGLADVAGEAAGVDAGDPGHAGELQPGVEVDGAAPVRRAAGQVAHDDAPAERSPALGVQRRHPVVADVGVGEGDDLPGVGGVGEDLLVAAQDGVEHDLAGGHRRRRPHRLALEDGAVGQHQQGLGAVGSGGHRFTRQSSVRKGRK